MFSLFSFTIATFFIAFSTQFDFESDPMIGEIQDLLEYASNTTGYSYIFGYKDDTGREFGLAAGNKTHSDLSGKIIPGNMTANDTGILGSGTKPFVATAIMKLVEQQKVQIDDFAYKYVDIYLQKHENTTMFDLFGLWANEVTIR